MSFKMLGKINPQELQKTWNFAAVENFRQIYSHWTSHPKLSVCRYVFRLDSVLEALFDFPKTILINVKIG